MTTSREKFYYTRTLCCLLKALEGVETEIELRNESHVKGTVEFVSGAMGVTMLNCELIVAGRMKKLQRLFVQGRKIRMVVVPDDINMIDAMQRVINMFNAPVLGRNEFKKRSVVRGRGEGRGRGISYRGKSGGGLGRARGRARGGVPWGAPAGDAGRGQVYGRGRGSSDGGEAGRGQIFGRGSGSRIGGDAGRGQVDLFGRGRDCDAIIADIGTSQVYEHGSGSLSSGARRGGDFGQGAGVRGMHIGTGTGRTERDQTQNQSDSDSDSALGSLLRPDYMSQQVPAGHSHSQTLPQVQVPFLSSAVGSMLCPDYMNQQVPAGHSHSQTLPQVQVPSLSSTESCASPESSQSWTDLRQKIRGNKNLQEGSRHKLHMTKESLSGHPSYSSSEGGESHKKHSRKSLTSVSSKHQIASSSRSETSRGERDSVKLKDRLSQLRHSDKHHDYPKHHTHVSHTTHRRASSSGEAKHSHSCRTRTESSERGDYDRRAEKYHGQTESERHDSRSRSRISPGRDGSQSSSSRGGSPGQDECKFVRDQGKSTRRSSPTSMSREHHKSSRRSLHAGDRPKSTRLSPARDQSASSRRRSSARDESKSKRSAPARD